MRASRLLSVSSLALVLAVETVLAQSVPLPEAKADTVGFSVERLKRLDDAMQATVDNKLLAGIVTLLARHGKLVEQKTFGQQDMASAKPMQKDTIFRIYSMTKPITGVAMMILYEEGKWRPSDPIAKYIPELKDLKVHSGTDASGAAILEAPAHAPTMGELMSHTAGFTYGFFGGTPVDKLYQEANPLLEAPTHAPTIGELMSHTAGFTYGFFGGTPVDKLYQEANPLLEPSLQAFIDRLAKLPLMYQPGEAWAYSVAVDVQGYLVEKLSGKPFPDFVRDRILVPLGMKDTAFFVPQEKLARLATVYIPDPKGGGLTVVPNDARVTQPPGLPSGGGGLYSTAGDYLRFAQMLLGGGELNGVRLLSPSSVQLMRSNHLPERLMTGKFGIGLYTMQPGLGFGYDVAVFEDPVKIGSTAGKGTFMWDGLAGTWFWIDPTNDVVFVGMVQRIVTAPGMPNMEDLSRTLVNQALLDPGK